MPYKLPFTPQRQFPYPRGVCGFTGTSRPSGMSSRQLKQVRWLLAGVMTLHLGDAVGADEQAHGEATALGIYTIGHPPDLKGRRAFCDYNEMRDEKPYLVRDKAIVAESPDGLIAAPRGFIEVQRGSGTWATIRYARKAKRKIWIVWPDGDITFEDGTK